MIFLRLFSGFIVQTVPFAILSLYPFKGQLRFSVKKTVYLTAAVIILLDCIFSLSGLCLNSLMQGNRTQFLTINTVFLLCLIPCFIWVLYVSLAAWQKKLFIYSFTLTGALALTSISKTIQIFVEPLTPSDGLPYSGLNTPIMLLVNAVALPLFIMLLRHGYIPMSNGLTKKEDRYLAILSLILFIVLVAALAFMDYGNLLNPESFILWGIQLMLVFTIYFFVFKMLSLSHERLLAQKNSSNLKHEIEILNEQHLRFNESIEYSRRMRHDLKHHMLTIKGFINDGELEKANNYLEEYIKISEEYETPKICDVPVINWIVNYYQMLAKENDIDFTMRVSTPPLKQFTINDADLSVLLGNLLENAVAGAMDAEQQEKYINLNIIYSGKMLVITVDNSFNGIVKTDGKEYYSTKEDHTGIGIGSIKSIAENYFGGAEFTNTDAVFHSSVMLNISR